MKDKYECLMVFNGVICCYNLCDGNTTCCSKITVKAAKIGNVTCVMYESKPLACTNSISSSINFSPILANAIVLLLYFVDFTNVAIYGVSGMPLIMLDALSAVVSVVLAPAVRTAVAIPGLLMSTCRRAFRPCSMYRLCHGVQESNTTC